jgi:hypothetical protein
MLSAILAIALLLSAAALIGALIWAARRFHLPWWATLAIAFLLGPFVAAFIFLAGTLTIF